MAKSSWLRRLPAKTAAFLRWTWYGNGRKTPWLRRLLAVIIFLLVPAPILYLLIFRFVPVPFTPQMALEFATFQPVHYSWRAYDDISPALPRAVIGSEDQNFCNHNGFDWDDIEKAIQQHERHPHRRLRGASTISQQVARTLFLLPVRSWVRKGAEAYLTVLLEAFWPKKRILTAYLNLVDWGYGNFGAEAAAEHYFHVPAARLTKLQAARLATILPNPDKWHAVRPGPYVTSRTETVRYRSWEVTRDNLDWCVR